MKALKHGTWLPSLSWTAWRARAATCRISCTNLQEFGCGFVSLGESWCDTTTDVGRLMMTIMGGIAEFERNLIRKRCEEGIQRAKRKGHQVRPAVRTRSQPAQAYRRALHCRRDHG